MLIRISVAFAVLLSVFLLLLMVVSGYSFRPLLYDVFVEPSVISPNADGHDDVTRISYKIARSADVSIYFENAEGERFYFRENRRRSPGEYDVLWGGVVNQKYVLDSEYGSQRMLSWVLPDGEYTWVVKATDDRGNTAEVRGTITLQDADTELPELRNFSVTPNVMRPNQDGLRDDRVAVSYFLTKDVEDLIAYLYDPEEGDPKLGIEPTRYFLEQRPGLARPTEAGLHAYDYDGGIDRGAQPPPDGEYVVVVEARDRVGNHVMVTDTLTIVEGGVPRAWVLNAEIHWENEINRRLAVPLGETMAFTAVVENAGSVPLRTAGPWPGTEYGISENYNTLAIRHDELGWHQQAGVWRFGINFETTGLDFPFRWAIGRPEDLERRVIDGHEQWYLMPGQRGLVTGKIRMDEPLPLQEVIFWGGLIHEQVGVAPHNNNIYRIYVSVDVP